MLTTFRIHLDDGTSYVTNMAEGITLQQAQAYFGQGPVELTEGKTNRVLKVEQIEPETPHDAVCEGCDTPCEYDSEVCLCPDCLIQTE